MTDKPQAKNAGRTDTKKIASKKPKEKVAALKNTQNEVAVCGLVPNHTQLMLEDLEPAHQREFKDALEIASIVLSGKSIEAALMQVRENVTVVFKDRTQADSINIAMNKKFEPHYGKEHLENIEFTQEIAKDNIGTFVVHVSKLGLTALGRREVEGMLNGKIPKPVEYKDREPVNGKKLNGIKFLEANFGQLIRNKAIYAHELYKLNKSLYKILSTTVEAGISSLMMSKSDKVNDDLNDLAKYHPVAHKFLSKAYSRE